MNPFHRLLWIALIALQPILATAAPEAELWERWLEAAQQPSLALDNSPWQAFLKHRLIMDKDGISRVDYRGTTSTERRQLERYLQQLQQTPVARLTRNQQRAFWINLYNAGTVAIILQHYPVDSIRDIDISPGLFSDGPWGKKLFTIAGEPLSLDDIEHRILRPIWRDNRIHYVLNCASVGCPNLQASAFTPDNTERLLNDAARGFINHPRGARVVDGSLHLSSIYKWFASDFGTDEAGIIRHLRKFAGARLLADLATIKGIDSYDYDWSLNEAR